MAWKLLRLKPLKPFFFGRENVFSNTNYATSEYFPQQTQIAGALRLYWMEQNHLMRKHKDGKYVPYEKKNEAIELVGNAGSHNFHTNDDLGRIQNISPMFILKTQNDSVQEVFYDIPLNTTDRRIVSPRRLNDIKGKEQIVILDGYNIKNKPFKGLGGFEFWDNYRRGRVINNNILLYDKVFKKQNQVGIALEEGKQAVKNMFYTKRSYMLSDNYEFGLLVEIEEDDLEDDKKLSDGFISIGADSSMFGICISDVPRSVNRHSVTRSFQNNQDISGRKIILLSDAILEDSIHPNAYFQIVPYAVPFKMIQSKDYMGSHVKTNEKLLVPKGSVYYFDEPAILEDVEGAYAKMGFNRYLVLN